MFGVIGSYKGAKQLAAGGYAVVLEASTVETPEEDETPSETPTEPVIATKNGVLTIADYAAANSWVNSTLYASIKFDETTTITSSGTPNGNYDLNTGKYYTNGENWRIYQNETPSVVITSTKTIASVTIEYGIKNTGTLTLNSEAVASGTTINVNANTITFSVGNTGTATNGQAQITKITIVYAE